VGKDADIAVTANIFSGHRGFSGFCGLVTLGKGSGKSVANHLILAKPALIAAVAGEETTIANVNHCKTPRPLQGSKLAGLAIIFLRYCSPGDW
jgi:hypothetical protein